MKANYLTTILVPVAVALSPAQSFANKKPNIAGDVDCVGTADIAVEVIQSHESP